MHSFTVPSIAVAAIAALPAVSAHGYVSGIVAGGKYYIGSNPNWYYQPAGAKVDTAGWYAMNQDNGFVSPDAYGTQDIACHKSATPGTLQIPVTAGSTISLEWNTWPDSHHGPVINYLAKCSGSCTTVDKTTLSWGKIQQGGLIDDSSPPGKWQSDVLLANNFTGTVTIPSNVASGNYVLRHEIIGLHAAGSANGAQNYPQCVNLQITGSGSGVPSGTAATAFYKEDDPGILISIYQTISNYIIPGPALWSGSGSTGGGQTTATTKTTAGPTTMTTVTKPTTTTTKAPTTTTTTSAPTGSCAAKYAQCGGQGWQGATCCVSGSTCKASGDYYSQCL